MTEYEIARRQARINAARKLLDFYEKHPTVRLPFSVGSEDFWSSYSLTRDEGISLLKTLPAAGLNTEIGDDEVVITHRFDDEPIGLRAFIKLDEIGDYSPLVEKAKEQLFNEFVAWLQI